MTLAILCPVDAISDGTSKGFQLENDLSVFVVGDDGAIFVYLNECPHLGGEFRMARRHLSRHRR